MNPRQSISLSGGAAGAFLAAVLVCAGCAPTKPAVHAKKPPPATMPSPATQIAATHPAAPMAELEQLARSDGDALLQKCLEYYQSNYRDYTCTFLKRERFGRRLSHVQVIAVKFRENPLSVAMHWIANAPGGDQALFVEGQNDGQVLVHLTGVLGIKGGWFKFDPLGREAMQNSLRPINQFGFERGLESLLETDEQARRRGDLQLTYNGMRMVPETGRPAMLLTRRLPPRNDYSAVLTRIYIDPEYLVPVKVEGFGWDGLLSFWYVFEDVRFNVNLTLRDFLPEAEPR